MTSVDTMERSGMRLLRLGELAERADLLVRQWLLVEYGELIAAGAAYGLTLAMRHPEYAHALYLDMCAASFAITGESEDSNLLSVIVDLLVKELPLGRDGD